MKHAQHKRTKTRAVNIPAALSAVWQASTPVALKDIKVDDALICNVHGGMACQVMSLTTTGAYVQLSSGVKAMLVASSLRQPPEAKS